MKPKYTVVSEYNLVNLRREVNRLVDEGYDPQGGLTVSGDPTRGEEVFYQAMYMPDHMVFGVDMTRSMVDKPNRMIVENPENLEAGKPKRPPAAPTSKRAKA